MLLVNLHNSLCSTDNKIVCYYTFGEKTYLDFFLLEFTVCMYLSMFLLCVHRIEVWDPFEHQNTIIPGYESVHHTVISKLQLLEERAKAVLLAGL